MVRTQVQLTVKQAARLRQLSATTGRSMADLIREAVDRLALGASPSERHERALSAVGAYAGDGTGAGVEHDSHLEEAYADWPPS